MAVIYVGETGRNGLYYNTIFDELRHGYEWGNYSQTTIANHINSALGSSFVVNPPVRIEEGDVTKDDILGKLVPAEP